MQYIIFSWRIIPVSLSSHERARKNIILLYISPRHTRTYTHIRYMWWDSMPSVVCRSTISRYIRCRYKERLHAYVRLARKRNKAGDIRHPAAVDSPPRPRIPTMEPTRWIDRVCLPREKARTTTASSSSSSELCVSVLHIHHVAHVHPLRSCASRVNYSWLHFRFSLTLEEYLIPRWDSPRILLQENWLLY